MRLSAASILLLAPLIRAQVAGQPQPAGAVPASPAVPANANPAAVPANSVVNTPGPAATANAAAAANNAAAAQQAQQNAANANAAANNAAAANAAAANQQNANNAANPVPGVGGGAPAPTTTQLGQVPSVTNVVVPVTGADGQISNAQVMYTQNFPAVPSQFSTASSGTIGMGSLTGTVGSVRTTSGRSTGERVEMDSLLGSMAIGFLSFIFAAFI
ncbi:MAG: hypothetical protein M1838_001784 [Thelocarpon superellum]|nr:MAG: hypothetical protein M1838_001784 [Thelocarpon superellum]